jgi:nucleoid DNA-binding protein
VKIEQALVYYLLKTKQLTLQGIGTFHLDASVPDYVDSDKPVFIPENSITFDYDPKVTEDEGLVDFIVEHTNKIKPLAASDLDSFLSLARQFLNIGKPLTLQNIGTLEKLNSGILAFKPGQLIAQKIEPNKIKDEETEGEQQEENLFNDYQKARKSRTGAQLLVLFIIIIILGAIGWAVWHFAFDKKNEPESLTSTEQIVPIKDSAYKSDSTIIANSQDTADLISFNVVINEYPTRPAAEWRLKKLQGLKRNAILYTDDSVTYKIAEPFTLPLSDTTRILDSIKRHYSKAYVEVK